MKKKILSCILLGTLMLVCGAFAACDIFGFGGGDDWTPPDTSGLGSGSEDNNPTHVHNMTYHEAVEPDDPCTGTAVYEYWECTGCEKYFQDDEGISEYYDKSDIYLPMSHNLFHAERTEPTCIKGGNIEFWQCLSCNRHYTDREATNEILRDNVWLDALGHDYVYHEAHNTQVYCNIAGWNEYHTCKRCDYDSMADGYFAPHHYVNGTYTCTNSCGTNLTATGGLEYSLNNDGETYTVTGIGTATAATQIVIPYTHESKNVTAIGYAAFKDCKTIVEVVIPNGVTNIGQQAFYGCAKLESVEIPNSVTTIKDSAFKYCTSLKRVVIPGGLTTIEYETFYGCSNLKCVEIPLSVTNIGSSAFQGCRNLLRIDYAGTKYQWDSVAKGIAWDSSTGKDDYSRSDYIIYCTEVAFTAYGQSV